MDANTIKTEAVPAALLVDARQAAALDCLPRLATGPETERQRLRATGTDDARPVDAVGFPMTAPNRAETGLGNRAISFATNAAKGGLSRTSANHTARDGRGQKGLDSRRNTRYSGQIEAVAPLAQLDRASVYGTEG